MLFESKIMEEQTNKSIKNIHINSKQGFVKEPLLNRIFKDDEPFRNRSNSII